MTPGIFRALFDDYITDDLPYVTFFHITKREIICFLCSSYDKFPELLSELGDVWFAKAQGRALALLTMEQVMQILREGPSLLFLGNTGDFKTDIINCDTSVTEISLSFPDFDINKRQWGLKELERKL
jgi:hypothetical protein